MRDGDGNGWDEYKRLVMDKLDTLSEQVSSMNKKLSQVRLDVAGLKIKAGVWGLIGSAIPVVIGLGIFYLKGI